MRIGWFVELISNGISSEVEPVKYLLKPSLYEIYIQTSTYMLIMKPTLHSIRWGQDTIGWTVCFYPMIDSLLLIAVLNDENLVSPSGYIALKWYSAWAIIICIKAKKAQHVTPVII